jgi:hypothetical protein
MHAIALRLPMNVRVFKVPVVKTSSPDELAAGHPMQNLHNDPFRIAASVDQ